MYYKQAIKLGGGKKGNYEWEINGAKYRWYHKRYHFDRLLVWVYNDARSTYWSQII